MESCKEKNLQYIIAGEIYTDKYNQYPSLHNYMLFLVPMSNLQAFTVIWLPYNCQFSKTQCKYFCSTELFFIKFSEHIIDIFLISSVKLTEEYRASLPEQRFERVIFVT